MMREMTALPQWEQRVQEICRCRICGNPSLETVIDLGPQALSCLFDDGQPHNQLSTPIPLEVVRCVPSGGREACGFIQLRHTVPPDVMFRDYGYRSGLNTTMRRHLYALTHDIESQLRLTAGDIVIDVGANDGTSLLAYRSPGIAKVGFEPSDVRPESTSHGIMYIPTFFSAKNFRETLPGKKARVITCIAMFYDIDNPTGFCHEIADVLSTDGLWVIEMGYWGTILENNGFDSICHEHLGYYSLSTLQFLCRQTGFAFYDITFNASNGGSVRCYLVKEKARRSIPRANRARIARALRQEHTKGYFRSERLEQFRRNTEKIKGDLLATFQSASSHGKTIYGYGASTKGNVVLQYCGIGPSALTAIADRNPAKRGRLTPGTRIPICSEDEMRRAKPDLLLILPWHFLGEFLERERTLRSGGTRFIVPFPEVRTV